MPRPSARTNRTRRVPLAGKLDIPVEEGSPIAQQAFYHFDFSRRDDAAIEARPAPSSRQTQGARAWAADRKQPATVPPPPPESGGSAPGLRAPSNPRITHGQVAKRYCANCSFLDPIAVLSALTVKHSL
jgi:hypothetical protein